MQLLLPPLSKSLEKGFQSRCIYSVRSEQAIEEMQCIRKFMTLAHLPVPLVRQHFGLLSTARSTRRLINRYPALFDFNLENDYIFGQYRVQRWNVYDRDIDTRTNNHVEDLYFLSRKISN
jgi:hypothetical protein